MKKTTLVLVLVVLLLMLVPSVAMAGDWPPPDDQPETGMFGPNSCGIYTGEYGWAIVADGYWAYYASKDTEILKCLGKLPKGVTPPASTVVIRGVPCFTTAPVPAYTDNSTTTIEPSGKVMLICKFKLN